ncbi:MAG TPA: PQQ-dependent sugar dehydrogenase [Candidatus Bipolaricaulota bacterium]|nr:PQQ-dependent sugar dehydrogenase [Candidatus Bipolaricaulota bacterium]
MKRKNLVLIIIAAIAVLALIAVGFVYRKYYRGLAPAFLDAPYDIAANDTDLPLSVPDGFSITVFAKDLNQPRVILFDMKSNVLVSLPQEGKVVALPDKDGDRKADEQIVVAENLNQPHGLAIRCVNDCRLYVAETDKVSVFDYDSDTMTATNQEKLIDLPGDGEHWTRTLKFLNKDKLLISVGSSCDTCVEDDWRRASILIVDADGSNLRPYASGLRNSVFMAISPLTGKLFATEMGRDNLGDELPPDEINEIVQGKNYGWPYCYGDKVNDANFDETGAKKSFCASTQSPVVEIPAHSAPLGISFVPTASWPKEYENDLLVAYHGSWNRTVPTGYKIVRVKFDAEGNYLETEDFITGWLTGDEALGRPVDIAIHNLGAMFVSDDKAGVIYRIDYVGK